MQHITCTKITVLVPQKKHSIWECLFSADAFFYEGNIWAHNDQLQYPYICPNFPKRL